MSYYIILRGPLGCGKTTIANKLAEKLNGVHIAVDDYIEKHKLYREKEEGYISQKSFIKVNKLVESKAKDILNKGKPVIFDGNFYWKSQIEDLIKRLKYPHYVFTLKAPLKVCIERDSKRKKFYGEGAATVVYNKVMSFDYGTYIDATKPLSNIIKELPSYFPQNNMKEVLKKGRITKLPGGDTGHTFLLAYKGKKYVLRKFKDKKDADYYVSLCKKLAKYDFLPRIYYQDSERVIFEFIEGRDCNKKDASKVAFEIGKICALVNKIKARETYDTDKRYFSYIEDLREGRVLNENQTSIAKELYLKLKKKAHPKLAMDTNDVYPENFRLRNGKVYLVDIEAILPLFRGHGIAKSFVRWFRTDSQRQKFKRGYRSISSLTFLTKDYLTLLYLYFLVRGISHKVILHKKLNPYDVKKLLKILKN